MLLKEKGRKSIVISINLQPLLECKSKELYYKVKLKISSKNSMKRAILAIVLLPLLLLSTQAFGQSSSSIGGSITDTSQAVLPGSSITVTNTQTGIASKTAANNAGIYNFPSLQPGIYQVVAEMKGFQKATKTDVKLGMGSQIRLNFELAVSGVSTEVEVTTSVENLVLDAGSSTGTVLQQDSVTQLPLASNDVMDLINIMGGVVKAEDPIFSNYTQTFAGVQSGNINIQRDGITVNEVRYTSGIVSPIRINQEMVGEFKMVLSPVDAEMGRGAGQVQILTKSGANAFHGSGVWNIQNTALDATEWYKNRVGERADWRNLNNYTLSASGPIIKNKTFFFATYDRQIVRSRSTAAPRSLTNCARKGIYRYLDGWVNNNANPGNNVIESGPTPQRNSVDLQGNPILTYNGVTSALRYESVLGQLSSAARAQIAADPINCSQFNFSATNTGVIADTPWDPYRDGYDASGYIDRFSGMMPLANAFDSGDGLNTAAHKWTRTLHGSDTVFGSGEDNERKSITFKIDHNVNSAHRLSGTYTYESDYGEDAYAQWPNGYGGAVDRQPQSFTVTLTSTLKPTLLNEFRFGLSRTRTHTNEPLNNPKTGTKMREILDYLMPTTAANFPNYTGYPLIIGAGDGGMEFATDTFTWFFTSNSSHPYGSRGNLPATWGGVDPRWSASDTITWTRGAHSFKGGFEYRQAKSWQESNGAAGFVDSANTFPSVRGGTLSTSPYRSGTFSSLVPEGSWAGMTGSDLSGAVSGNYTNAYSLLNYMAGSVGNIKQFFYLNSAQNLQWNDPSKGELNQVVDLRNREMSAFFKDDWKVNNSLTLNLGVRYEYYGVPWENSGKTAALIGGSQSLWGISGGDFSTWMPANPGAAQNGELAAYQLVGKNSPNPDGSAWNKDMNNFAPHVGFSWQLPWFGKGKTTLRGGYSVSYSAISNFDGYAGIIAKVAGTQYQYNYTGGTEAGTYINMSNLGQYVPLVPPSTIRPMTVRPVTDRSSAVTVYDDNIRNPYIQSLNLSVTRNIGSNLTVDVRYIASLSRKQISGTNLNQPNYINNGLFAEFDRARNGLESTVLDTLIPPWSLWFAGSGAEQLRTHWMTSGSLMTGDYAAVASALATANPWMGAPAGTNGGVLRAGGAAENLIYTNPQFSGATINANLGHSNYHSMQAQMTMQPTHGLSFQTTYTWSRNLADQGITNYLTGVRNYYLSAQHRSHQLNSYGSFEIPFGANGYVFRNATGAFKKAIEGWQLSWILSLTSGVPGSITGASHMWGNSNVDFVGPAGSWDNKSGNVTWASGSPNGLFFGDKYVKVVDPQCATIGASLQAACSSPFGGLQALALRSDPSVIVFQNAKPGTEGNFQPNQLAGPGRWALDMTMGKSFEFMEGKKIDFRVDAQNIFNHPTPSNSSMQWNARFTSIGNPNFSLNNSDPLGYLGTKGGHRTFQAKIRITF
jgi:hypothetical protein